MIEKRPKVGSINGRLAKPLSENAEASNILTLIITRVGGSLCSPTIYVNLEIDAAHLMQCTWCFAIAAVVRSIGWPHVL